jgi:hypothetical protein
MIKRMRVEPISTYLERYRKGGVAHPVTIANGLVYLSGLRRLIRKAARSSHNRLSANASWC